MKLVPQKILAGVTLDELITVPGHPSDVWLVTLHLRGPAAYNVDLEPLPASGPDAFTLSLNAADTASWLGGQFAYFLRAKRAGRVVELESGVLTVTPDLTNSDAVYDPRSHAERTLEAIEAVLEKRATTDQQRYSINNRELWRTPIPELLALRNQYRSEVRRQRAKAAGKSGFGRLIKPVL